MFATIQLFAKLLFQDNPRMNEYQMLSVRCAIHFLTVLIILKFSIKQICWDSIPDNQFLQVLSRAA